MEPPKLTTTTPRSSPFWLRRGDQMVLAAACALAIVAMGVYFMARVGWHGELLEFDEAPPIEAQFQVDINTADWSELAALPEIGESIAKRIVDERAHRGPFRSLDDLDRISGIGPKRIERLRPYLGEFGSDGSVKKGE